MDHHLYMDICTKSADIGDVRVQMIKGLLFVST